MCLFLIPPMCVDQTEPEEQVEMCNATKPLDI